MSTFNMLLRRVVCGVLCAACAAGAADEYYAEPPMFHSRPSPKEEKHFGDVGVTGLRVRIYPGVTVTVEETVPGTPAAGKFAKGEVITGVNGAALKGKNPYVVLGSALTQAEATDGKLVFDVRSADGREAKQVTVVIPVLGAYSPTWPLNCKKSKRIVAEAAAFYADPKQFKEGGIPGALACLFLLSTGDDQYLPRVKAYFDAFPKDVRAIGDNTWDNGYNGIACAEYYLRTGDESVLPILQYYCDDAKERQCYGVGWGHWGRGVNPGYVAGGLMNPAGAQVVTTLLLAQECGVKVDQPTLLGALRQWYRFAGHGTVPYGDHRGEGGLGSNGKDGMAAAMMQVASYTQGDPTIYKLARDYLSMSTLDSYPTMVLGHGDEGRGDGIWRGMASAYMLDVKPREYHQTMQRLQWWFDLSRRPSGGLGMATCQRFDDVGSGAGLALAYTAPLKTLRITGAPRSKHAKNFSLPKRLWGAAADLAFLSIEHGRLYRKYGPEEPAHIPFYQLGSAYHPPADGLEQLPRRQLLKNVYHRNYMIRAQAAKALRRVGAFDELEKLLQDKDPRVRRAALDGLTDYNYWFAMGNDAIRTENFSPAMQAAIRKMLSDPEEAWYVVDGALMAMNRAPAQEIVASLPLIRPWTAHEEWWLRQSSFLALSGAAGQAETLPQVLPILLNMMVTEDRAQPREGMEAFLTGLLRQHSPQTPAGKQMVTALLRAAQEVEIRPGVRSCEGAYYVLSAATSCLRQDPAQALDVARILRQRFAQLEGSHIASAATSLLEARKKGPAEQREALTDLLYGDYRQELVRRMEAQDDKGLLDTIVSLTQLRNPDAGWRPLGTPAPSERIWRFRSFDPPAGEVLHPREKKRFRDVTLPAGLEGWQRPEFDASAWPSGKAPIGKGVFKTRRDKVPAFENRSDWGDGEFLLARTTFELDALDYDFYRIRALAKQGYHIYLNGENIHTYIWWQDEAFYQTSLLGPDATKHLKKGTNVLAVYANTEYIEGVPVAQLDVYLEGLTRADLLGKKQTDAN